MKTSSQFKAYCAWTRQGHSCCDCHANIHAQEVLSQHMYERGLICEQCNGTESLSDATSTKILVEETGDNSNQIVHLQTTSAMR